MVHIPAEFVHEYDTFQIKYLISFYGLFLFFLSILYCNVKIF